MNTQIFVDVFLIEVYEYAALRKELLIIHFIQRFKRNNWEILTYNFVSILTNVLEHCFFVDFYHFS